MHPSNTPVLDFTPPSFSQQEAERIARELFDVYGVAAPLPSERDQNFLVDAGAAGRFVLKLAHASEQCAVLEAQNEAIDLLVSAGLPYSFPAAVPTLSGERIADVVSSEAQRHQARILRWVEGVPLALVRVHSAGLLRELGAFLGSLDRTLQEFAHPAAQRTLKWDLRHAHGIIEHNIIHIDDAHRRTLVETMLASLDFSTLSDLRSGVIHGDANDYNVLVRELDDDDPFQPRRIAGIIDFGDLVHSWVVGEVAIAAAYAMLGKPDPLEAAAAVTAGYHASHPLGEEEIAALFPLVCLRLCTSVVLSAQQRKRQPQNTYLAISEQPAWKLLERLARVSPALAQYTLRNACGFEPCPLSSRVRRWLHHHHESITPVIVRQSDSPPVTLDLTPGSLQLAHLRSAPPEEPGQPWQPPDVCAWTETIFGLMQDAGSSVAIGRYDEIRRWSSGEPFRVAGNDGDEYRTLHIGLDLFAEPGTPVYAPLDGIVFDARDNAEAGDYGPTVVLEHVVEEKSGDALQFFTLYGHLTRTSLLALRPGARVQHGERIGDIGSSEENGGWAPHLHIQLICDPLGDAAGFPGVARPSQRALWVSLSPDPAVFASVPPSNTQETHADLAQILERRRGTIGPSLSISYRRPLHIVRGWMQHLYDAAGQPYLDAVNNVAHVGHSHPGVVEALAQQNTVLNTNTRYLHENIVRYAERLAELLPPRLSVLYFVCSGSEANELALRLARAHTRRHDVLVVDAAYHGNTSSLVELSPYKFNGPGGAGQAAHVHVVPLPDVFRGLYRDHDSGERYAAHVHHALCAAERAGRPIAAFFAEPLPGCGGQIVPPPGWLAAAFAHARAAGAVCVADEVQTGFGRVGSHFWAFEAQDATPDIVTMGKPIGNGHPLGAVATTPEIAASFTNGMEYFNTFGGNPVSCAVGLAVLDVVRDEGLQANARHVGEKMLAGLHELAHRHPLIGDVRGMGFYVGVELIRRVSGTLSSGESLMPAGRHAAWVAERMRDFGILLSTDGPDHNVLKIKPPLVFTTADADRLISTLDRVLEEIEHTLHPT